jgi:transposase
MPQRVPLAEIDYKRRRGTELSQAARLRIWDARERGLSWAQIEKAECVPKSTARWICDNIRSTHTLRSKPRSGRPHKTTLREERQILRLVRSAPKWTWYRLLLNATSNAHKSTIRRLLHSKGIIHWIKKKRLRLTKHHARLRLTWCLAHRNTDWSNVIFRDECLVGKGVGQKRQWSFGYPSQKWDKDKIQTFAKGKQGTVMVWGAFGLNFGAPLLVIMERDLRGGKNGYTSRSYIWALEEGLIPYYNGEVYQQDNAPIHTSREATEFLAT